MFKDDRILTSSNKKLIEKIRKVHDHLKKIVDNTKQHCDFCKIMNITKDKWEPKTFKSNIITETIDGKDVSIDTMPLDFVGNSYLLCDGCKKDEGYDELNEKDYKDIKLGYDTYAEDDPKYKDFIKAQKL